MVELNRARLESQGSDRIIEVRAGLPASPPASHPDHRQSGRMADPAEAAKIVRTKQSCKPMPALAWCSRSSGSRNVLRHLFISYRIAMVQRPTRWPWNWQPAVEITSATLPRADHAGDRGEGLGIVPKDGQENRSSTGRTDVRCSTASPTK